MPSGTYSSLSWRGDNFLGISEILAKEEHKWYLEAERNRPPVFYAANQEIGKAIITIAVGW
jgi:hypothetical protein